MKNRKALILLFSVLFLSLLLVGCLPPGTTPTPTPANKLPIITSTPITVATVGFVYSYDVNATDPDGDTLTYTLSVAPSGMNIDYPTGIVSWSPSSLQLGDNEVVVRVSDGTSSVTQSFIIVVSEVVSENNFYGYWVNEDENTSGITKVDITQTGNNIIVYMWGKCHPTDCDWAEMVGGPATTSISDANDGILNLIWEFDFCTETQELILLSDGRLKVIAFTHFTDNSGRPDYESTEYFIK